MKASREQLRSRADQIRRGYRVRVTLDLLAGAVVGSVDGHETTAAEPVDHELASDCGAERIPATLETAL